VLGHEWEERRYESERLKIENKYMSKGQKKKETAVGEKIL